MRSLASPPNSLSACVASTRRMWKPNAMRKRVFSELLGHQVPLSLTAHTLRCIDKAGGAWTMARRLSREHC